MDEPLATNSVPDAPVDETVADPPPPDDEIAPTLESMHGVVVEAAAESAAKPAELAQLGTESATKTPPWKRQQPKKRKNPVEEEFTLPPDWRKERKTRASGSTAGMVDTDLIRFDEPNSQLVTDKFPMEIKLEENCVGNLYEDEFGDDETNSQLFSLDENPNDTNRELQAIHDDSHIFQTNQYYYEPVTGRKFRSLREVRDYLEGIPKKPRAKVKSKETKENAQPKSSNMKNGTEANTTPCEYLNFKNEETDNTPVESSKLHDKTHKGTAKDCRAEPEESVKGVQGSWSPFVGDEMVPEPVKREWASAFASLSRKNGSQISQPS